MTLQSIAAVKYNYEAQQSDELSLVKGSRIQVLEKSSDGWWKGEIDSKIGWFPSNYVVEEPLNMTPKENKSLSIETNKRSDTTSNLSSTNNFTRNHSQSQAKGHEVVVALYSFTSQNEEELSFQKGERLEIIDKPTNDPDWWMARNSTGDTGLVPKNYVHVTNDNSDEMVVNEFANLAVSDSLKINANRSYHEQTIDSSIQSQPWYFGSISRTQCDRMLNEFAADGDFLIRDSETNVS